MSVRLSDRQSVSPFVCLSASVTSSLTSSLTSFLMQLYNSVISSFRLFSTSLLSRPPFLPLLLLLLLWFLLLLLLDKSNVLFPYSRGWNGLSLWSSGSTRSFELIGCRFETQLDTQEKNCRVFFLTGHFSDVFLLNRLWDKPTHLYCPYGVVVTTLHWEW